MRCVALCRAWLRLRLELQSALNACVRVAGYDVAACEQPAAVGEALRYLVTMPSAACFLLCLVSLYFYPINETKREANRKKLERLPCALTSALTRSRLIRAYCLLLTAASPTHSPTLPLNTLSDTLSLQVA